MIKAILSRLAHAFFAQKEGLFSTFHPILPHLSLSLLDKITHNASKCWFTGQLFDVTTDLLDSPNQLLGVTSHLLRQANHLIDVLSHLFDATSHIFSQTFRLLYITND